MREISRREFGARQQRPGGGIVDADGRAPRHPRRRLPVRRSPCQELTHLARLGHRVRGNHEHGRFGIELICKRLRGRGRPDVCPGRADSGQSSRAGLGQRVGLGIEDDAAGAIQRRGGARGAHGGGHRGHHGRVAWDRNDHLQTRRASRRARGRGRVVYGRFPRARPQELQELAPLAESPAHDLAVRDHLLRDRKDLARPEVEPPIELLRAPRNLAAQQVRIRQRAHLGAAVVDECLSREPPVVDRLTEELGAGIRRGDRYLNRVGVNVAGEADGFLDGLRGLAWQSQDERAVDLDPERLRALRELAGDVQANALLHVVQDLLVAGLVSHEQQAEPVVLHDLQRLVRNVGFGVAGPRHAELAQTPRERLDARQIVGQRVVVEKVLAHQGEVPHGKRDLVGDVPDAARAIPMSPDRLRPQTERAFRPAAPSRIERHVRMQQIANRVVLDDEVALVNVHHERQRVHILEHGTVRRVSDRAVRLEAEPEDGIEPAALSDFLDREVELVPRDEVDRRGRRQRPFGIHCDVRADESDPQRRVLRLQRRRHTHVVSKRRCARV